MEIFYRKLSLSWLIATMPFLCFFVAIGYFSIEVIKLPPDWRISHVILLAICIVIYLAGFWFIASNLWVSSSHEFNDKVITRYRFLGFPWTRIRSRDEIKEIKSVETGGSPFGSRRFLLLILFNDGTSGPVYIDNTFTRVQTIQKQVEVYLQTGKRDA
jgi:hypothetical protein